jgi:hypothetical protein
MSQVKPHTEIVFVRLAKSQGVTILAQELPLWQSPRSVAASVVMVQWREEGAGRVHARISANMTRFRGMIAFAKAKSIESRVGEDSGLQTGCFARVFGCGEGDEGVYSVWV